MNNPMRALVYAAACAATLCACTPTIRVEVAPINVLAYDETVAG